MERLTLRDYFGNAYVPGYAPVCSDKKTCELVTLLVERVALLEDMLEGKGTND